MDTSEHMEFVSMPNLHIKNEPLDDPEITESEITMLNDSVAATDPMNLLELVQDADSNDETQDSENNGTEESHSGSNSDLQQQKRRWKQWVQEYPWVLHEGDDGHLPYCLYCNISFVVMSVSSIRKHMASLQHQECEENYIAFKIDEEKAKENDQVVDIKQEFGTSSSVSAMKFKRISQVEPLNSFKWRRWLKSHDWLVRDRRDGTVGYCKLCAQRVNVEFSYLRLRHEVSGRHRDALRKYKLQQKAKKNNNNSDVDVEGDENQTSKPAASTEASKMPLNDSRNLSQKSCLEMSTKFNTCRCTVCNVKMEKSSFRRHLLTQLHATNLRDKKKGLKRLNVKTEPQFNRWKVFSKSHPWLVADPKDALLGYCKYCKKTLFYAYSSSKRILHENSIAHKTSAKEYKERESNKKKKIVEENKNTEEEDENAEEDAGEEVPENEDQEEEDGSDNHEDSSEESVANDDEKSETSEDSKQKALRNKRFSDAWFKAYPWCQKNAKDPAYMYCTYCKLLLSCNIGRVKHSKSARHVAAEKEYLLKGKKEKPPKGTISSSAKGTGSSWLKCGGRKSRFFCKYCRVGLPTIFSRKKHEHSSRHRETIARYKARKTGFRKPMQSSQFKPPRNVNSQAKAVTVAPPTSMQAKVMQWKAKLPWITYKRSELRPNYAYCKFCERSLFAVSYKNAAKHGKSSNHIRMRRIQQLKIVQESQAEVTTAVQGDASASATASAEISTEKIIEENRKAHPWLLADPENQKEYGFCKYCNIRLYISGSSTKKKHQRTLKHRAAEKKFHEKESGTQLIENPAAQQNTADSTVVLLDDDDEDDNHNDNDNDNDKDTNNDEVSSVKSETETNTVLEYLIRRQMEKTSSKAPTDSNRGATAKRSRYSTQSELLRTLYNLNESSDSTNHKRRKTSLPGNILNSPMALAACLSPFMQRDDVTTPERNTYDLFFDSVSETVKKLPNDLAAEARIKVMQIIYDLELRAMQRKEATEKTVTEQQLTTEQPSRTEQPATDQPATDQLATELPVTEQAVPLSNIIQYPTDNSNTSCTTPQPIETTNDPIETIVINGNDDDDDDDDDSIVYSHVATPKPTDNSLARITLSSMINSNESKSKPAPAVYQLNHVKSSTSTGNSVVNGLRKIVIAPKITPRTEPGIRCIPINSLTNQGLSGDSFSHIQVNRVPLKTVSTESSCPMLQSQLARPQTNIIHVNPQLTIRQTVPQPISKSPNANYPRILPNPFYT